MSSYEEAVLQKIPITQVLLDYCNQDVPASQAWQITCPFHYEHKHGDALKSARVYPRTNSIFCFGTHGHINSVKIVQICRRCSRQDAILELSMKYGVDVEPPDFLKSWEDIRKKQHTVSSAVCFDLLCRYARAHGWMPEAFTYIDLCIDNLNLLVSKHFPSDIPHEAARSWLDRSKNFLDMMCKDYHCFRDPETHFG